MGSQKWKERGKERDGTNLDDLGSLSGQRRVSVLGDEDSLGRLDDDDTVGLWKRERLRSGYVGEGSTTQFCALRLILPRLYSLPSLDGEEDRKSRKNGRRRWRRCRARKVKTHLLLAVNAPLVRLDRQKLGSLRADTTRLCGGRVGEDLDEVGLFLNGELQ
jgi:hypothetical protein